MRACEALLLLANPADVGGAAGGAGCELCETNRVTLEKAWQVVANEYYDARAAFGQEAWARTLLSTLKVALRTPKPVCRSRQRGGRVPEDQRRKV